VLTHFSKS